MNNKPKIRNPWNKNEQVQSKPSKKTNIPNLPTPAEAKFKEAQQQLHSAALKHANDYESSSSEEEIEGSATLIEKILWTYTETGGSNAQLGRTQKILEDSFISSAGTCLICISKVKRDDRIWSCSKCYAFFHLSCIQRWSKDTIIHQTQSEPQSPISVVRPIKSVTWCCPKCRGDYLPELVPTKYLCFCTKTENPKFQPFLVPHSCGELCKKNLHPLCGHQCLLLCHPGPCPPCPVTVIVTCNCKTKQPRLQRCSNKNWSCGNPCKKLLQCGKHYCSSECHADGCPPCTKKSVQKCMCKAEQKLRDCAAALWQCERVCGKPLECGHHTCDEVCHAGVCDVCSLSKLRSCPCGKSKFQLPCTQDTPTCLNSCDKLLSCGKHFCNQRCHKGDCGLCLETVEKSCRCGQHKKEVQCYKFYSCESKCKNMKDCNKHPCNKKCCDGNCPPCEKPCGKTLSCGNHKCSSVCHRGPCYPCRLTEFVQCFCGATKLTVPCGRKHRTKPPKCPKPCRNPPDCHHKQRESHRCHFGDCQPCKQVCSLPRKDCAHLCPACCHSSVLVKIESKKASMPWEQSLPQTERKALPCPRCMVPMPVTCFGKHETSQWPCYLAIPSSCHRPCGRLLPCENHLCKLPCHRIDKLNCEPCEGICDKERPKGCQHSCPKPCHPGACPPCTQMLRIKCHCGLSQPYVACNEWLKLDQREEIQSCGNQCPHNYECGHRCKSNCHSGECPNPAQCKKKMKVSCKCKRIKKEFQCETVRNKGAIVECDEVCLKKKEEVDRLKAIELEAKLKEEVIKNKKELEKYEKMFEGKKKNSRERRRYQEEDQAGFIERYKFILMTIFILLLSICIYFALY